ncbi:hypothetical protein [Kibdelosporangium phytohabitans]|uniref:Uncharacterized protein n=1 Tax=Kibdelosporangium phytohabitans TaxID=860235 RepID=A0A0N9I184_9PSEU|nr:hypothetical protein [Kibdelosporangium phytohabitans]ALG12138.1 hypothetical protein AOZ06_39465 [Kibdelosporangium phytohabitans]MBE1463648.1 hypothetical protein [Kibdelosporangium phytohabitans]
MRIVTQHDPHQRNTGSAASSSGDLGSTRRAAGATEAARSSGGRMWWVWALLALILIGLLIFALARCSNDDDRPTGAASPPAPSTPSAQPDSADMPPGALQVGGRTVWPAAGAAPANGALTTLVGQQVSGRAVPVQSVPADEGFWVGTSDTDRMWVKLVPNGESPVNIQKGQMLDLGGPIVAHGREFAASEGVDDAEGATQLTAQAAHIEAQQDQVRVVG